VATVQLGVFVVPDAHDAERTLAQIDAADGGDHRHPGDVERRALGAGAGAAGASESSS